MLILHQYKIKKELKTNPVASDQLYDLTDLHEFLLQQNHLQTEKKIHKAFGIFKRLSPFLLVALLMPAAVIYLFVMKSVNNGLLLCFSFVGLEINILFIDFALWNYYEGKKILRIWLIETCPIFITAWFVL